MLGQQAMSQRGNGAEIICRSETCYKASIFQGAKAGIYKVSRPQGPKALRQQGNKSHHFSGIMHHPHFITLQ
ncbi:hypothetical protein CBS147346_6919 [Aspergillus niger]|nr:hypothetical protein CBS147346_6919 [Aspergillus niger]